MFWEQGVCDALEQGSWSEWTYL